MIERHAAATLRQLAVGYPVVTVVGPRQSGKTTLVRATFPDRAYVSLEDLDEREAAVADPRGFLARFPDGAILDEVQNVPELLSYLQGRVDEDRRAGLFILTGSQQLGVLAGVSQTLAGRAAILPLLGFSLEELAAAHVPVPSLSDLLFNGLYPPIHDRHLDPSVWYGNYVQTYVERDVRQMINVRDLRAFQTFIRMCAARCGQLVNLSALGNDCGITYNTAKAWLSVLEASYIVHVLQPYHGNFGKRLIKTPKLYFLDPGLAAWLLRIESREALETHAMRGPLFESWVVSELLKARFNRGRVSNLYFWRSRAGHEVDALVERGATLDPVEIKAGQTLNADFFSGLLRWVEVAGAGAGRPWLVYGGDERRRQNDVEVAGWRHVRDLTSVAAS